MRMINSCVVPSIPIESKYFLDRVPRVSQKVLTATDTSGLSEPESNPIYPTPPLEQDMT